MQAIIKIKYSRQEPRHEPRRAAIRQPGQEAGPALPPKEKRTSSRKEIARQRERAVRNAVETAAERTKMKVKRPDPVPDTRAQAAPPKMKAPKEGVSPVPRIAPDHTATEKPAPRRRRAGSTKQPAPAFREIVRAAEPAGKRKSGTALASDRNGRRDSRRGNHKLILLMDLLSRRKKRKARGKAKK